MRGEALEASRRSVKTVQSGWLSRPPGFDFFSFFFSLGWLVEGNGSGCGFVETRMSGVGERDCVAVCCCLFFTLCCTARVCLVVGSA